MLVISAPSGVEKRLEEAAELLKASPGNSPEPTRLTEIAAKYDTECVE